MKKYEEYRLDAFEMKGLRQILRVSWLQKKTYEWVLQKAGVNRELLATERWRKFRTMNMSYGNRETVWSRSYKARYLDLEEEEGSA